MLRETVPEHPHLGVQHLAPSATNSVTPSATTSTTYTSQRQPLQELLMNLLTSVVK